MLPRNLRIATAAAIACFLIGDVMRATADVLGLSHAGSATVGRLQILSIAGSLLGFVVFIYCLVIKPEQPPGWRARRRWSVERLGPAAVLLASLATAAIVALLAQDPAAAIAWKLLNDGPQFAFALIVWESRWLWKQYVVQDEAN